MLTSEEVERLERYSVERERQRYTDDELWAWLKRLKEREDELIQSVAVAYYHAFSPRADRELWWKRWNSICNELKADELMKLLAWHLIKRGDEAIAEWLKKSDERQRQLAAKAQTVGWRMVNE